MSYFVFRFLSRGQRLGTFKMQDVPSEEDLDSMVNSVWSACPASLRKTYGPLLDQIDRLHTPPSSV